jgi:uncharacterized protein involved in exopolysaccharide biosynthesis
MTNQGNEMISIAEFIEIVRRRKMSLGVSVVLALLLVLLYNHLATQLYEASASVVFENYSKNTIVDFEVTKTLSWASFVANRIQEMQTTAFARRVYEELPDAERRLFRLFRPLPPQFDREKYIIDEINVNLFVRSIQATDVVVITFASESPRLQRRSRIPPPKCCSRPISMSAARNMPASGTLLMAKLSWSVKSSSTLKKS